MLLQITTTEESASLIKSILKFLSDKSEPTIIILFALFVLLFGIYTVYKYIQYKRKSKKEDAMDAKFNEIIRLIATQGELIAKQQEHNSAQAQINSQILQSLEILNRGYSKEIDEMQAKDLLTNVYGYTKEKITGYVMTVIRNNNIQQNKESIQQDLSRYVESLWKKDEEFLSRWYYKGTSLDKVLKSSSIIEVIDLIMDSLLKTTSELTVKNRLKIQFDGYLTEAQKSL